MHGTVAMDGCKLDLGARNKPGSSERATDTLKCWATSWGSKFKFYSELLKIISKILSSFNISNVQIYPEKRNFMTNVGVLTQAYSLNASEHTFKANMG